MSNYRNLPVEQLAALFKALSNPQRLQIFLNVLDCFEECGCCETTVDETRCCVGDVGTGLDLAASTISHHIKELRQAGLLKLKRRGQRIECWIEPNATREIAQFVELVLSKCVRPELCCPDAAGTSCTPAQPPEEGTSK